MASASTCPKENSSYTSAISTVRVDRPCACRCAAKRSAASIKSAPAIIMYSAPENPRKSAGISRSARSGVFIAVSPNATKSPLSAIVNLIPSLSRTVLMILFLSKLKTLIRSLSKLGMEIARGESTMPGLKRSMPFMASKRRG